MAPRDALAAILVVSGVIAVSLGGFLVSTALGCGLLGGLLLVLGLLLGIGDHEGVEGYHEAAAPAPALAPAPARRETISVPLIDQAPVDNNARPASALISLGNYLGRTGESDA